MTDTPASKASPSAASRRGQELPPPRLWRSRSNRVALGVIGGLAEKIGWEAKPLRILAGLLGVLTLPIGALPVVVPYLALWAITQAHGPAVPSKPFRRSRTDQKIAGVLGGLAEWLGMRPGVVRAGYVGLTIATLGVPGVVGYLVMWAKTPLSDTGASRER